LNEKTNPPAQVNWAGFFYAAVWQHVHLMNSTLIKKGRNTGTRTPSAKAFGGGR